MPLTDEVRNLLLKYIAGETNETESKLVESWLAKDTDIFAEFEQLWDLWYAVGTATNVFRFNVDKGWDALLQMRMEQKDAKKNKGNIKRIVIWASAIAAALLALVGWWYQPEKMDGNILPQHYNETQLANADSAEHSENALTKGEFIVKTKPESRKEVTLPDGSVMWLNGNSVARYVLHTENNTRTLYLKGQAFFDIHPDAKKPFIVETKHASIRVLGTRFDIQAYSEDDVTEAVLTGGSIQFITKSPNNKIIRHIDPGQKISLNYISGQLKVTQVDTAFYASWKEGKLMFRNETFLEVAKAMEHKYNIGIVFKNKSLEKKRLNGYLQKESLEEALKALKLTLQFQYTIENNVVTISR